MANPENYSLAFRLMIIAMAVVFCFLTAGVVFGYSPLKSVLIQSGVYRDLCEVGEQTCTQQKIQLDFMFTVAASATNVSALLMGIFPSHSICRFI